MAAKFQLFTWLISARCL